MRKKSPICTHQKLQIVYWDHQKPLNQSTMQDRSLRSLRIISRKVMACRLLLATTVCICVACTHAQTNANGGFLQRGSGSPVGITYLTPPASSPYAAPSQAPVSMLEPNVALAPAPTTIGSCYCASVSLSNLPICPSFLQRRLLKSARMMQSLQWKPFWGKALPQC